MVWYYTVKTEKKNFNNISETYVLKERTEMVNIYLFRNCFHQLVWKTLSLALLT